MCAGVEPSYSRLRSVISSSSLGEGLSVLASYMTC